MNRSLILAAALALAGATHASAADRVLHAVDMTATVDPLCSFAEVSGSLLTNVGAASSTFAVPIDQAQAKVAAETVATLTFDEATCNANTTVTLSRLGFLHNGEGSPGTPPPGVRNEIEYDAAVMWSGGPIVLLSGGNLHANNPLVGPRNAPLELKIIVAASDYPLVAGTYSDTLTLTVDAN